MKPKSAREILKKLAYELNIGCNLSSMDNEEIDQALTQLLTLILESKPKEKEYHPMNSYQQYCECEECYEKYLYNKALQEWEEKIRQCLK